jgi:ubiquinol-cytochrome c reductase cytochrome c1 subunit
MPPPLQPGQLEFEDGTPATVSQMAKDVTQFLCWTQDPMHDERKLIALKVCSALLVWSLLSATWHRTMWVPLKTLRLDFTKTRY